jgi:hypothetical protein
VLEDIKRDKEESLYKQETPESALKRLDHN